MPAYLLVRCADQVFGLAIGRVIETMRPPRVDVLPHTPAWLAGSAIIRGEPTPVLDLRGILQLGATGIRNRLVVVRLATRRVGLLVDEVHRVASLADVSSLSTLVPFLEDGAISHLSDADGELVSLLDLIRLVDEGQLSELMP